MLQRKIKVKQLRYIGEDLNNQPRLAIDRVHRIGQEKTVYVKHFVVSSLDD